MAAENPDLVGISVRNLENIDFPSNQSYVPEHRRFIKIVKEATAAPVVVGGGGFSVAPDSFLAQVGGDVGVMGEGEEELPRLAEAVAEHGGLPDKMRRAVLRARRIDDIDALSADRSGLDQAFYHREAGCATVQTKRGCNLRCSYCTYPLIEGRRVRGRSVEQVAAEMEGIGRDWGVKDFTIVDSIFNNPEIHAMELCEELVRKNLGVKWTAYFRPKAGDPSFFKLLARAGCSGIDATPDSLSEATLESLGKDLTPGDVEAFCAGAGKEGLPVNLNFIFGAPGETERTVRETFERIERCNPKSVITAIGVRLYPKAAITQKLTESGAVEVEEVGVDPVFYISEAVSGTLVDMLERIGRSDRRWIIPGLGIRYNPRFFRRLRKHGKKGPIWKFV